MKKTLVLTHEYFPFKGGVARYVYNLFKFFPLEDYLVATDHPEVKANKQVIKLKLKNNFIRPTWLFSYFKLKRIIKENKIEQIFTPNILPLGSLAYFLKVPYIISLHGLDIKLALKNKPALTKKILGNAKYILVNSLDTQQSLADLKLPEEKIKLFYPSIDPLGNTDENKLTKLRQELNIAVGEKILLTVGRLAFRKGHDLVIKALAQLRKYPVQYLIVGQGEEQNNLLKLIKQEQLTDKVRIINRVEDNELIGYYNLADIFILPHRSSQFDAEGFGIVFAEAAQAKLPIIAGQSGGASEWLINEVNALLVAEDVKAIALALERLLTDNELSTRLAAAVYDRSQEFIQAPSQARKLAEIL